MEVKLSTLLRQLRSSAAGRYLNMGPRFLDALSYYIPILFNIVRWTFKSREYSNFTYDITPRNLLYATHIVSVVTHYPIEEVSRLIDELRNDAELKKQIIDTIASSKFRSISDPHCEFARRLIWYAFARITKPQIIVETGVDKGLGAVILCAALKKNFADGYPGRYFGTDINPDAGWLLRDPYDKFGKILYGDSIQSLEKLPGKVDLFINDSDHSADYEAREYEVILPKLSERAIVLGDNSHVTDKLAIFSQKHGRKFIFFREDPHNHWYPGAGVGVSFL
jgi:predicted O-methyltransferase YrrM